MLHDSRQFTAKAHGDATKLRGGYYTPDLIARFIARWVSEAGTRILEPSCGDGAIFRHLTGNPDSKALGIELVPSEANAAARYGEVVNRDFFAWLEDNSELWDGVAGNPPYIRFGNWDEVYRAAALRYMRQQNLRPSRLMNAWVSFVVAATNVVRTGGRVGLVLPAELLQVGYAAELREFLVEGYSEITLVTFRRLVFDGILQEVVLFLGVTGAGPARIRVVHAEDADELADITATGPSAPALLHDSEKWTKYFLDPSHVQLLRAIREERQLQSLGGYAEVQVGIVTGRNSFFTMTRQESEDRGIADLCVPLVARTAQLSGLIYSKVDHKIQMEDGVRAMLLLAGKCDMGHEALRAYVEQGEQADVHLGYKCSIRSPWWIVPSYWVPDGFMFRQIHTHPRVVSNDTNATSTDTVHRVRLRKKDTAMSALAAGAFNSATFAFSEIIGRSYGGGIHELEPSEAVALPIVDPDLVPDYLPALIDQKLRARDLSGALLAADEVLLRVGLGWTEGKIQAVNSAWRCLRQRRSDRGRRMPRRPAGAAW